MVVGQRMWGRGKKGLSIRAFRKVNPTRHDAIFECMAFLFFEKEHDYANCPESFFLNLILTSLMQLGTWIKSNPPGAVGISIALETIIQHCSVDVRPLRYDVSSTVLICSRGGGGLLEERMELVAELWEENIKAEFVPVSDPSLTEQYEYANEHDIKCIVIVTDNSMSQKGTVKVRHLELKKEKEVDRENLAKFLLEAMATQFRNPAIWN
ncbi:eukaryotic translation initiation factor 2-alpha kinase [Sarracenia purpurea var. burkii]